MKVRIFKGKHLTTNLVESKHSQAKGNGTGRKQQDEEYDHQLFALLAFLVEYEYLPFTNLSKRSLYKDLMGNKKKKRSGIESLKKTVNQFKPS